MITLTQRAAEVAESTITDWLVSQGLPTDACAVAAVRWIVSSEKCGFSREDATGRQFIQLCSRRGVDPVTDDVTAYKSGAGLTFIVGVQTLIDRAHATGLLTSIRTDVVLRTGADGKAARIARAIVRRWVPPTVHLQRLHTARVLDALGGTPATADSVLLPVVERTFRAEANVDEWANGQNTPFWKGKPEHQAQLVALRRALRNSGLVADPDGDLEAWSADAPPSDTPDAPAPPTTPRPTGSPAVDRARAALVSTSAPAASTTPTQSAARAAISASSSTPAPAAQGAPLDTIGRSAPESTSRVESPPRAEDATTAVRDAARAAGLTLDDVLAFCQRWRGAGLNDLSADDRRTLLTRVLTSQDRIATAEEHAWCEQRRASSEAWGRRFRELTGVDYSPARLVRSQVEAMRAAAATGAPMTAEQREDLADIVAAFGQQKWQAQYRAVLDAHGAIDTDALTERQAMSILAALHAEWDRLSAEQSRAAAAGGWA